MLLAVNTCVLQQIKPVSQSVLDQIDHPLDARIDDEEATVAAWGQRRVELSPISGHTMLRSEEDGVQLSVDRKQARLFAVAVGVVKFWIAFGFTMTNPRPEPAAIAGMIAVRHARRRSVESQRQGTPLTR